MSAMQEFIEKWNGSIEGFKMTSEFLENPTDISVLNALEAMLMYMEYNVDAIKDRQIHWDQAGGFSMSTMNIFACIRTIHENISSSKKIICIGDICHPSPKRTLRILCESHNFALYYKFMTEEMKLNFDKRIDAKAKKRADRDELTDRENTLSMEIHNWTHKTEKGLPKLHAQGDQKELDQNIQDYLQDISELEPRFQQYKEDLLQKEKEMFLLKEKINILKGQQVLDPESLERALNDVKIQNKLQKDMKTCLEAGHKAKMERHVQKIEEMQKMTQLLHVDKKNIELASQCIKINKECSHNTDENDLEGLEKKYEAAQNIVKVKKNELAVHNEHINAESKKRKEKLATLQSELKDLHEKSIETQKYIKDSQSAINYAEDATEQLENMSRERFQKEKDFEQEIDEWINEIHQEAYNRCIKYKPI